VLVYTVAQREFITLKEKNDYRTVGAFACFFMWVKMFYWMKLFKPTAYFLSQITQTTTSVGGFFAVYFLAILSFANFFYIVQFNVPKKGLLIDEREYMYVEPYLGNRALDSIVNMYLLSLGEFALDGYTEGHDRSAAWIMFVLATFFLMLLLLNFIITVMGEPFATVQERRAIFQYQTLLEMIVDNIDKVNLKTYTPFQDMRYILVVSPEETTTTDEATLEDRFARL